MMWEIKGKPVDPKRFMPFEPLRVLNYYDGPRIFTFHDSDDALCLACWSDEDEKHSRFLVVAVNDRIVAELEGGLLSVREALTQPRLWVVDWATDGTIAGAWLVAHEDVPNDSQPQPRMMLHRAERAAVSRSASEGTAGRTNGKYTRTERAADAV